MRTTPKITITLEGNSWEEILSEMSTIKEAVKRSRIEDNPVKGIVAPKKEYYFIGGLSRVLKDYNLGPGERAEILERMR